MSSTLMALKAQTDSRLVEEKKQLERKRNLMIMILQYCTENGYLNTAETLKQEAGVSLSKFKTADNIDLYNIIQEFEAYYEIKFGRKPKLVRRLDGDEMSNGSHLDAKKRAAAERRRKRNNYSSEHMPDCSRVENSSALKAVGKVTGANTRAAADGSASDGSNHRPTRPRPTGRTSVSSEQPEDSADGPQMGLVGTKAPQSEVRAPMAGSGQAVAPTKTEDFMEQRLLKPCPHFDFDPDMKALAATISRDIYQQNPNVRWNDIVGLEDAKRLLKEAVVMPTRYPQLFKGPLLSPWCGILLFGPPGTGKTLLAKAVASECRTTFFNISASSIVSKYRGDSEKLVRMLFELARYHAPSTIFLDEVDAIMGARGSSGGMGEHEASRRMKTELLIQLDGLAKSEELVFLLAASNLPWELDLALLRRLEKRVLVPLPEIDGREAMVRKLLTEDNCDVSSINFNQIAVDSEHYSGADLKLLCKEAAMQPLRRLMRSIEEIDAGDGDQQQHQHINGVVHPEQVTVEVGKIDCADVKHALARTKPTARLFTEKYLKWQAEYGSS